MPKNTRSDDTLVINDENDRILEIWFRARASADFCEQRRPSDCLFLANIGEQEDRRTLASCLNYAERVPQSIEVCFLRRKVTLSLPFLEHFVNKSHTVLMYAKSLQEEVSEGVDSVSVKPVKTGAKKHNPRKEDELFSLENAEQLFFLSFELIDLMTTPSLQFSVPVPPDVMLQDCMIEVSCGTPFLPPAKLNKYRPLEIEVHSIWNIPRPVVLSDPLFVSVKFGDIQFQSPELLLQSNGKVKFRRVFFLGTRTPLDVYRDVFFQKIEVSVFRGGGAVLGSGAMSLRAAAMDRQIEFSETVQLIPDRFTFSRGENCLTQGSLVSLRVSFFIPLPQLTHVLSDGRPVHGQFLTRGIIRMPYAGKWVANVLEAFIGTLLQLKKTHRGSDVYQLTPAMPEPVPVPVPKKKKDRQSQKAQALLPQRPPSPPSAFDVPFMIVTPPGISGFEVMDENVRIIVIEGPAMDVHKIFERLSAAAGHDPQLELLMNAELFVPKRAYLVFPPLVTVQKTEKAAALRTERDEGLLAGGSTAKTGRGGCVSNQEVSGSPLADPPVSLPVSFSGSSEVVEEMFDSAGSEAGGTGGRIHRIRIRETIESLMSQQRYLLKRMLSDSCVRCYTKLHALCRCSLLRDVLERDLFPTPEELISLERFFGLTLELSDIFGKQEFVSAKNENDFVTSLPQQIEELETRPSLGVRLDALRQEDVGKIVLFEATKVMFSRRRVPASVQQRYPQACWMSTLDTNTHVLCAFPNGYQPGGTIRYLIEAQVVRCEQTLCLYSLEFSSLAKSCTNSRNPEYENYYMSSRRKKTCLRPRQKGQKISDLTSVFLRHDGLFSRDDESSDGDDPLTTVLYKATVTPQSVIRNTEKNFVAENKRKVASLTKKVPKLTAADYELCWELYRQRSPPTHPNPPKGPPMHF